MTGAEVLTKFTANTKDLDNKTKSASNNLKTFASGVTKAFKVSAVAIGAMSTAIGAVVKASVNAYSEFEQLEGGLVSLFGEGSSAMNRILGTSEKAWEDLTMSQNEYLTAFQSAYPLVNAGLSENADSIEYTNKMLQLSSDLFNTYGGSVEQYQNAINWALKGSFVYLDNLNLGIKGTQEGFIEAANASGILGREIKNVSELTSDEIIDVIQHYAEAYGVWGKTGEEAATTIIGSLNMTKSAWNNLVAGFSKDGANMNKLIDNFIKSAMTFGKNIIPVIERALNGIVQALPTIIDEVGKVLPGLIQTLLPVLINGAVSLINSFIPQLPTIIQTILPPLTQGFISIVQNLAQILPTLIPVLIQSLVVVINSIAQQLPTLIPILTTAILDGLLSILDNIDLLIDCGIQLHMGLINGIMAALPILIEKAPEIIDKFIMAMTSNFPKLVEMSLKMPLKIAEGMMKGVPQILSKIPQIISSIINGFKNGLSGFADVGKNMIKGLWKGAGAMKDWAVDKFKGIGKSVLKGIKNVLGIHSPSTEFALIGKFSVLGYTEELDKMTREVQGQIAETFSVSPQLANSSSLHYSPNVVTNTYVNVESDPLGQTVRSIKTFAGGSKNDFNYGQGV